MSTPEAVAAVAAIAAVMLADEEDGTAPKNAERLVSADERAAKVKFGDIEAMLDRAADQVADAIDGLLAALAAGLAKALFGDRESMDAQQLLAAFNMAAAVIPAALVDPLRKATEEISVVAADVEVNAAGMVAEEAARQDVAPVEEVPEGAPAAAWIVAASAAALAAWERVVTLFRRDVLTPEAVASFATFTRSQVETTVKTFGLDGAKDMARQVTLQANRAGRDRGVSVFPIMNIFASEIMDGNTCNACAKMDGEKFEDLEQAREAYPFGGYKNCAGGLRCRGTLVFILDEDGEVPPPPPSWTQDAWATLDDVIPQP